MTLLDTRAEQPEETQVLFREARQRRRRRWLVSGTVALIGLVLLVGILGVGMVGGSANQQQRNSAPPAAAPASIPLSPVAFAIRPALCYAPAFSVAPGQPPAGGPLPSCRPTSLLTTANLDVEPDASNVGGFTFNSAVDADPQFAAYPSTPAVDASNAEVLLAGTPGQGGGRYVLGPVSLTASAVRSASASLIDGQWAVLLRLTSAGSARWDDLARQQFHAIVGVVINGRVASAPITQPTQSFFTSFNGHLEISGSFTEHQAKTLAAGLTHRH